MVGPGHGMGESKAGLRKWAVSPGYENFSICKNDQVAAPPRRDDTKYTVVLLAPL